MKIEQTTTWDIDDDDLDQIATDILTTAVEGGINYWASVDYYQHNGAPDFRMATVSDFEAEGDDAAFEKTTVTVGDLRKVLVQLVVGGPRRFFNDGYADAYDVRLRHLFDELSNGVPLLDADYDFDANDADCVFQLAAFGEVMFG